MLPCTVGVKEEGLFTKKKVADLDVRGCSLGIIMTGQIYYHLYGLQEMLKHQLDSASSNTGEGEQVR